MRQSRRPGLTSPSRHNRHRTLHRKNHRVLEQAVLTTARRYGTPSFLAIQTVLVAAWIVFNAITAYHYLHSHLASCTYSENGVTHVRSLPGCGGTHPFDFYPFVLLNFFFSLEATYAAPVILYAQNRAERTARHDIEVRRARIEARQAELAFLARELADLRQQLETALTKEYLRDQVRATSGRTSEISRPG